MKFLSCEQEIVKILNKRYDEPRLQGLFASGASVITSCPCPFDCNQEHCVFDLVLLDVKNNEGYRVVDKKKVDWNRDNMEPKLGYCCVNCMEFIYGGGDRGVEQYVYLSDCDISLCYNCVRKGVEGVEILSIRSKLMEEKGKFIKFIKENNTIRVKNEHNEDFPDEENPETYGIQLSESDYLESRRSELSNKNKNGKNLFCWESLRKNNDLDEFKKNTFVVKRGIISKKRSKNKNVKKDGNNGAPTAKSVLSNNNQNKNKKNKKRNHNEMTEDDNSNKNLFESLGLVNDPPNKRQRNNDFRYNVDNGDMNNNNNNHNINRNSVGFGFGDCDNGINNGLQSHLNQYNGSNSNNNNDNFTRTYGMGGGGNNMTNSNELKYLRNKIRLLEEEQRGIQLGGMGFRNNMENMGNRSMDRTPNILGNSIGYNNDSFMSNFAMCAAVSQNMMETDQLKSAKHKKAMTDVQNGNYPHIWEDFIEGTEARTRLLNGLINNTFGVNNKKQILMGNPSASLYCLSSIIDIWTDKVLEYKNKDGAKAIRFAEKSSDASTALLKLIRIAHSRDTTLSGIFGMMKQACLDLYNTNDKLSVILESNEYDSYRKEHYKEVKAEYRKYSAKCMNILSNENYSNGRQKGNYNNYNNRKPYGGGRSNYQGGRPSVPSGEMHKSFVQYKDQIPMKYLLKDNIDWKMCYQYNIKGICSHPRCKFQNCGKCLDCGKTGCWVNKH